MSYAWWPYVRFTPTNGIVETWDLRAKFSDVNGPVRTGLDYVSDRERRVSSDERRLGLLHRGFRPRVDLELEIFTLAHQSNFATLLSRLRRPADWLVELALDGGITYRAVQLDSHDGPTPLGGKTFIGARHRVRFDGVELLADLPDMYADPAQLRELVYDGGFEQWTSATVPTWFIEEGAAAGSPNQESSVVYGGTYSMRLERTGGATYGVSQQQLGLVPNCYYRSTVQRRSNLTDVQKAEVTVGTPDGGVQWYSRATGLFSLTQPGAENYIDVSSTVWQLDTFSFLWPFPFSYRIDMRWRHRAGPGNQVYYDAASIVGPVRPPGISAW